MGDDEVMGVTVVMVVTWVMKVATGVMGPKEIKRGIAGREKSVEGEGMSQLQGKQTIDKQGKIELLSE